MLTRACTGRTGRRLFVIVLYMLFMALKTVKSPRLLILVSPAFFFLKKAARILRF